jgi:regulator of sirC expression with transglutaminase-like and TPR domain
MIAAYGLMDDENIELDIAALKLSELDHEGIDLTPYIDLLREISERLADVGKSAEGVKEQAAALAQVLSKEYGFTGDAESYDAPLNADLIRVLDRRRGLPVSLSLLYVAAARRIAWTADVLNIPGHVLVRIGATDAIIIDPFNDGRIVPPNQLTELLARARSSGVKAPSQDVGPMTNRAVLARLLMNQASRAEDAGDHRRARTIYERMTKVAPDLIDAWHHLARLQLSEGNLEAARQSLSSMLEVTRDPERRHLAITLLEAIAAR